MVGLCKDQRLLVEAKYKKTVKEMKESSVDGVQRPFMNLPFIHPSPRTKNLYFPRETELVFKFNTPQR